MWCPNEKCLHRRRTRRAAEYREGVSHCADCGAELVASDPARPPEWERVPAGEHGALVAVGRTTNLHEAHLVREGLVSRGVDAVLWDAELAAMNWFVTGAVGGIKIMVPADQEPLAQELLDEDWAGHLAAETGVEADACYPPCPACGSPEVHPNYRPIVSVVLACPIPGEGLRCGACGHRFVPAEQSSAEA